MGIKQRTREGETVSHLYLTHVSHMKKELDIKDYYSDVGKTKEKKLLALNQDSPQEMLDNHIRQCIEPKSELRALVYGDKSTTAVCRHAQDLIAGSIPAETRLEAALEDRSLWRRKPKSSRLEAYSHIYGAVFHK